MKTTLSIWFISCLICASTLLASVPEQINYQGTLTDSSGNPITDTPQMDFAIYADSTMGDHLWSETHSSVEIVSGLFQVQLGTVTPLPSSLFNGNVLWLGITVSPDVTEMTPRQSLVTVPYGFRATYSDTAAYALAGVAANT